MALRELLLKLGVEVDDNAQKKAENSLAILKKAAVVAAGAFAALGAVKAVVGIADQVRGLGDEIDKTSKQLGISTDALQEFRFAADLAGVSGRTMSESLAKVQRNAFEAARGNKLLAADFERLGVSVRDANGQLKSGEQLTTELADGFKGLDNDSERVALSINLFGRAGKALIPLLTQGSDAIREQRKEAQQLGGVLDQNLIKQSAELTDSQTRLSFAFQGLKNRIAEQVIPVVDRAVQLFIGLARELQGPLKRALQFASNIFGGLGTAMGFVLEKMSRLGFGLSALGIGVAALGIAFKLFGTTAVIAGIKAAGAWLIAIAPMLLTIALFAILAIAILLVIDDFEEMGKGGDSVTGTLIKGFEDLVKETGSWSKAVKEIFFTTMDFWFGMSRKTFDKILVALDDLFTLMTTPVRLFLAVVQSTLQTTLAFITDVFTVGAERAFLNLWDNIKFSFMNIIDEITKTFRSLIDLISIPLKAAGIDVEASIAGATSLTALAGAGFTPGLAAARATLPPPPAAGGASFVNQGTTTINTEIDATGRNNPEEIATEFERVVENVLVKRDQKLIRDFAVAAGG